MKILLTGEELSWNANLAISVIWWEINDQIKCAAKAITENKCHSIYGDSFFQSKNILGLVGWRKRKTLWRREWQPPPVSLPGEFHGQRTYCATNGNEIKALKISWEESKRNVQSFAYCEPKYIHLYIHTHMHIYIYTHTHRYIHICA